MRLVVATAPPPRAKNTGELQVLSAGGGFTFLSTPLTGTPPACGSGSRLAQCSRTVCVRERHCVWTWTPHELPHQWLMAAALAGAVVLLGGWGRSVAKRSRTSTVTIAHAVSPSRVLHAR